MKMLKYTLELTKERNNVIKSEICSRYNLDWEKVESKSRKNIVVDARRMYCGLLRNTFGLKYDKIGKILNKTHATIIHNSKQHDIFMKILKSYRINFEEIESILIEDDSYYSHEMKNIERNIESLEEKLLDLVNKKNRYKNKINN
jgi:chromosomal replication initiation ATPase DnaA